MFVKDTEESVWFVYCDLFAFQGSYFHYSKCFAPPEAKDISPRPGRSDPMYIVQARKA